MSLSNPQNNPSKPVQRYYIGQNKARVPLVKVPELHWTEQMKYRPKDTTPRPIYDQGDTHQNRWDMDWDNNITKEKT